MLNANDAVTDLGRVLVIGGGRMGEAVLSGLLGIEGMSPSDIAVAEPSDVRREHLGTVYNITCISDASQCLPVQTVFLAVKPQVLSQVAEDARTGGVFDTVKLVVSIAAGRTCASIESLLPAGMHLVRVMPNMPLMVGEGTAAVAAGSAASKRDVALVCTVFSAAGSAVEVTENPWISRQRFRVALPISQPSWMPWLKRASNWGSITSHPMRWHSIPCMGPPSC